jgi:uncharacterized cupredoxin-like copper-binding protein
MVAVVAAVVLLAVLSTLAIAAMSGGFGAISCDAPRLPGRVVHVALDDMGGGMMMGPTPMHASLRVDDGTVAAGQVSFVVRNRGGLVHEMLVLPLPRDGPGTRPVGSDGKVDEAQSLGEASRSCGAGVGDGLAPGSTGWLTLNLTSGRYELICNEPWHYAAGMFDVLTVRSR